MKNKNELLKDFNNVGLVGRAAIFNNSIQRRNSLMKDLNDYFKKSESDPKKLKTIPIKPLLNNLTLEIVQLEENRYALGISGDETLRPLTEKDFGLDADSELLKTAAEFFIHPYWYLTQFLENR